MYIMDSHRIHHGLCNEESLFSVSSIRMWLFLPPPHPKHTLHFQFECTQWEKAMLKIQIKASLFCRDFVINTKKVYKTLWPLEQFWKGVLWPPRGLAHAWQTPNILTTFDPRNWLQGSEFEASATCFPGRRVYVDSMSSQRPHTSQLLLLLTENR